MRNHFHWFVVILLDEDVVGKGDGNGLAVVIGLKEQVEVLLDDLLLGFGLGLVLEQVGV